MEFTDYLDPTYRGHGIFYHYPYDGRVEWTMFIFHAGYIDELRENHDDKVAVRVDIFKNGMLTTWAEVGKDIINLLEKAEKEIQKAMEVDDAQKE